MKKILVLCLCVTVTIVVVEANKSMFTRISNRNTRSKTHGGGVTKKLQTKSETNPSAQEDTFDGADPKRRFTKRFTDKILKLKDSKRPNHSQLKEQLYDLLRAAVEVSRPPIKNHEMARQRLKILSRRKKEKITDKDLQRFIDYLEKSVGGIKGETTQERIQDHPPPTIGSMRFEREPTELWEQTNPPRPPNFRSSREVTQQQPDKKVDFMGPDSSQQYVLPPPMYERDSTGISTTETAKLLEKIGQLEKDKSDLETKLKSLQEENNRKVEPEDGGRIGDEFRGTSIGSKQGDNPLNEETEKQAPLSTHINTQDDGIQIEEPQSTELVPGNEEGEITGKEDLGPQCPIEDKRIRFKYIIEEARGRAPDHKNMQMEFLRFKAKRCVQSSKFVVIASNCELYCTCAQKPDVAISVSKCPRGHRFNGVNKCTSEETTTCFDFSEGMSPASIEDMGDDESSDEYESDEEGDVGYGYGGDDANGDEESGDEESGDEESGDEESGDEASGDVASGDEANGDGTNGVDEVGYEEIDGAEGDQTESEDDVIASIPEQLNVAVGEDEQNPAVKAEDPATIAQRRKEMYNGPVGSIARRMESPDKNYDTRESEPFDISALPKVED